jgi:hypothetical protein
MTISGCVADERGRESRGGDGYADGNSTVYTVSYSRVQKAGELMCSDRLRNPGTSTSFDLTLHARRERCSCPGGGSFYLIYLVGGKSSNSKNAGKLLLCRRLSHHETVKRHLHRVSASWLLAEGIRTEDGNKNGEPNSQKRGRSKTNQNWRASSTMVVTTVERS